MGFLAKPFFLSHVKMSLTLLTKVACVFLHTLKGLGGSGFDHLPSRTEENSVPGRQPGTQQPH